jgi:hypothetical protein
MGICLLNVLKTCSSAGAEKEYAKNKDISFSHSTILLRRLLTLLKTIRNG